MFEIIQSHRSDLEDLGQLPLCQPPLFDPAITERLASAVSIGGLDFHYP